LTSNNLKETGTPNGGNGDLMMMMRQAHNDSLNSSIDSRRNYPGQWQGGQHF
jgi:hypothetical protein